MLEKPLIVLPATNVLPQTLKDLVKTLSSHDGRECQDHFGLLIISLNSFFGLYSFKDFKEQVSLVQSSRIGSNIYRPYVMFGHLASCDQTPSAVF